MISIHIFWQFSKIIYFFQIFVQNLLLQNEKLRYISRQRKFILIVTSFVTLWTVF